MIAIFDIDGVLADTWSKLALIKTQGWDALYDSHGDEPMLPLTRIVPILGFEDFDIVFVSSRPERTREATTMWLKRNLGISFPEVVLKPDGHGQGHIWKVAAIMTMWPKEEIAIIFEDDPRIAIPLMRRGYPVVCVHSGYHEWPSRGGVTAS